MMVEWKPDWNGHTDDFAEIDTQAKDNAEVQNMLANFASSHVDAMIRLIESDKKH